MIMLLLKRVNILRVYFTTLTVPEYVILFLICAANGTLQNVIYTDSNESLMKKLSVFNEKMIKKITLKTLFSINI